MKSLYKISYVIFISILSLTPSWAYAQQIAGGGFHSLSICSDGSVKAWGLNKNGQLGNGTNTNSDIPVPVSSLTGITSVAAGEACSFAIKNDGTLWAWGYNLYGQLGDGTTTNSNVPVQVSSLSGIIAVSSGRYHTIALKNDGTVWGWGYETGNGSSSNLLVPTKINGLTGITSIAAGGFHFSVALKNDGTVWTWGDNTEGQLGKGTQSWVESSNPVAAQLSTLSGIVSIKAGYYQALALKNDGTLWAWGKNNYGQIGDGTTISRLSPVMLTTISDVSSIAMGYNHNFAIKKDGTVYGWGLNSNFQYGSGGSSKIPLMLSSLTNISAISAGSDHSMFLKKDGMVWAMGSHYYGQLGIGTTITNYSADPGQVNGLCPVSTISIEQRRSLNLSVLPNPSNGIIHIAIGEQDRNAKLSIVNLLGQIVYAGKLENTITTIDTSHLKKGIYLLIVESKGTQSIQKITME